MVIAHKYGAMVVIAHKYGAMVVIAHIIWSYGGDSTHNMAPFLC